MSESDRELLEIAAKAAGYAIEWREWRTSRVGAFGAIQHAKHEGFWLNGAQWCPLTNDGDALRLAVKLNLLYGKVFARGVAKHLRDGSDIYAATRRAIVIAAAEIWRELP